MSVQLATPAAPATGDTATETRLQRPRNILRYKRYGVQPVRNGPSELAPAWDDMYHAVDQPPELASADVREPTVAVTHSGMAFLRLSSPMGLALEERPSQNAHPGRALQQPFPLPRLVEPAACCLLLAGLACSLDHSVPLHGTLSTPSASFLLLSPPIERPTAPPEFRH
ncbi:hypothetical protein G7Z17_g12450 [Cylindrodendrum hubeiense]|uniref:Uncharacterized protein n=1 Tax=Cylindrodendrum hubeiense TaxID=595255 RepID=A0A9P5H317_9HYPO|nr:hypothetical protein G7Z17_g12450 [Cylindrodendrum hubeiense]